MVQSPGLSRVTTSAALSPEFYARDAESVARELLGSILVVSSPDGVTSGLIVETEAYTGPEDAAAHGFGGRKTTRNASMFLPGGSAYVYFIYGMHWCFNAVTGETDFPAAVLIRALEPLEGIALMKHRRGKEDVRDLCSGPAKLCQAMSIDQDVDGAPLTGPMVAVTPGADIADRGVTRGPRIGISKAVDEPLRFWVADSDYVSA